VKSLGPEDDLRSEVFLLLFQMAKNNVDKIFHPFGAWRMWPLTKGAKHRFAATRAY